MKMKTILIVIFIMFCISADSFADNPMLNFIEDSQYKIESYAFEAPRMTAKQIEEEKRRRAIHAMIANTAVMGVAQYNVRHGSYIAYRNTRYAGVAVMGMSVFYVHRIDLFNGRSKNGCSAGRNNRR
jgi:hypothetical protein